MHARQQIRDAVVALLTGLPTTGARVHAGRTRPLAEDHDPTLLVYTTEERSQADTIGRPVATLRELTLRVEGRVVSAAVPPDDALDDIAAEVEAAIGADPTLGLGVIDSELTATRILAQAPGQRQAGEITLDYLITYRTRENAPTVIV